jgi:tetratricopeptide (TPR) repeat protein
MESHVIPVVDETATPVPRKRDRRRIPKIFLTYRILDSESATGRLKDHLKRQYGPDNVFQDVDGVDDFWSDDIESNLQSCDVQIVVIGRTFLAETDKNGKVRLFVEGDWVTGEIRHGLERAAMAAGRQTLSSLDAAQATSTPIESPEPDTALSAPAPNSLASSSEATQNRKIRPLHVIPVVVDGAAFPFPKELLPASIHGLFDHQAVTIRGASWDGDFKALVRRIRTGSYYILGIPKRLLTRIAAGVAVVALIAGSFIATRTPGKMGGDTFNIAVADFQTVDVQGKPTKSPLGRSFSRSLGDALSAKRSDMRTDLRFWKGSAGTITGTNDEQRQASAIKVANRRGADLVIYGTIVVEDNLATVKPGYLVSNRRLTDELRTLFNTLYKPQDSVPRLVTTSPQLLAASLVEQSASVARLFAGMGNFAEGAYDIASDRIEPLNDRRREPGWTSGLGANPTRAGLVSYMLGVGALADHEMTPVERYAQAEELFNSALQTSPGFALAEINLARIGYLRAKGDCTAETINRETLKSTRERLSILLETPNAVGDASPKAASLASEIAYCELQAGVGTVEETKRWLSFVIDSYEKDHPDIVAFAANAHGRLGWLLATREFKYQDAAKELDQAVQLMNDAGRAVVGGVAGLRAFRDCVDQLESDETDFRTVTANYTTNQLAQFRRDHITNFQCPLPQDGAPST